MWDIFGGDRAAVALRGLLDDGEAKSGAWLATRLTSPVEAFKDVRKVFISNPRSLVGDREFAVPKPQLDGAARLSPFRSVVEQVGDRALKELGIAIQQPRTQIHREDHLGRASTYAGHSAASDIGKIDWFASLLGCVVAG